MESDDISISSSNSMKTPINKQKDLKKPKDHHHHEKEQNLRKLYISVLICILFMTGEIIGGLISGSLAILTDAAHIFSDILGFCISIISIHISKLPASRKMSFGFHRAEVLGALLSIALIWGLTAWLLSEAIHRMIHLSDVDGKIMLITAVGGLLGNIIMGLVLGHTHSHHHHSHDSHSDCKVHSHDDRLTKESNFEVPVKSAKKMVKSLNMRAAVLHVIGDALQSVGVIIAGIVIFFNPDYSLADPICTLIFSVIVMITTVPIVKDCINVLMEGTPNEIDTDDIEMALKRVKYK